ncbi:uncharacterized protein LOC144715150 [Wolffia australiana]
MASQRSSVLGERPHNPVCSGVVKRSVIRHSLEDSEEFHDLRAAIGRGGVRAGERRKAPTLQTWLYMLIIFAVGGNVFLGCWLYRSTENRGSRGWRMVWRGDRLRKSGPVLRFEPSERIRMLEERGGLDGIRSSHTFGVRPPRLAVVLGRVEKGPTSVLLFTVLKGLKDIGYHSKIFAVEDGDAEAYWKEIGGEITTLNRHSVTDWSIFEGVILCSAESGVAISSLMKEPFLSVPVIWIIQEDILGERLLKYPAMDAEEFISGWRRAFSRADVVVFSDFSLPILHSSLDTGNFFVVPGSPVDVWAAEIYAMSHSKDQLRRDYGIDEDDAVITVVGSYFMYDDAPWDSAAVLQLVGSQLMELSRTLDLVESFQVIFLSGNSTADIGKFFEDDALRRQYSDILFKRFALDGDADAALLMADVVLYGSMHEEQSFPSLLIRAMTLGVTVIAPDLPEIKKYVSNGVDGLLFHARDPRSLSDALRRAVNGLSFHELVRSTAAAGKLRAKNMLAWDCAAGYAKLLENLLHFPSSVVLPRPASEIQQRVWEWRLLGEHHRPAEEESWLEGQTDGRDDILAGLDDPIIVENMDSSSPDDIDPSEWADVEEMGLSKDAARREAQQVADRTERPPESWEETYAEGRRVSKTSFENYERDEGELDQVGLHGRIYETYCGAGAWPFLHRGPLYRGLSLEKEGKDSRLGDALAVDRLPQLVGTPYKDLLCEFGAILAVAYEVDGIHRAPWIGFQPWRAAGRKVSLSAQAEMALTEALQNDTMGDVFYFWAKLDLEIQRDAPLDFWSTCDILNNGRCRDVFQESFRRMYSLPENVSALPPMPATGHWSTLHSWVMPTPSFMEFIRFSRMFIDALDATVGQSAVDSCPIGSSTPEKERCFCRMLELLVNVWAYHSARRMVHVDPLTGKTEEQHPFGRRSGLMWVRFFNESVLKGMDTDLADSALEGEPPRTGWLWPLTGEVYGMLAQDKEREAAYRAERRRRHKEEERSRRLERGRRQRPLA